MVQSALKFTADGKLNTLMPVPDEMKADIEEGYTVREDGFAVVETSAWKEENGKFSTIAK